MRIRIGALVLLLTLGASSQASAEPQPAPDLPPQGSTSGRKVISHDEVVAMMADEISRTRGSKKSDVEADIRRQQSFMGLADSLEKTYKAYFSEARWYNGLGHIAFTKKLPADDASMIKQRAAGSADLIFDAALSAVESNAAATSLGNHLLKKNAEAAGGKYVDFSIQIEPSAGQLTLVSASPLEPFVDEWLTARSNRNEKTIRQACG